MSHRIARPAAMGLACATALALSGSAAHADVVDRVVAGVQQTVDTDLAPVSSGALIYDVTDTAGPAIGVCTEHSEDTTRILTVRYPNGTDAVYVDIPQYTNVYLCW